VVDGSEPAQPANPPGSQAASESPQPARSWLWQVPIVAILFTAAVSQWGGALATLRVAVLAVSCTALVLTVSAVGPKSHKVRGLTLMGVVGLSAALLVALAISGVQQAVEPGRDDGRQQKDEASSGARLLQNDVNAEQLRATLLRGAVLDGLVLRGLALQGLQAQGASFRGTDLRGADLRGADLRGACLAGAQIERAKLAGADFSGSDVSGAAAPPNAGSVTIGWPSGSAKSGACR
jgi:hypothetical protein